MSEPAEINLDHLDRLTDSTGLIQHAIYSLPRRDLLDRRPQRETTHPLR